MTSPPRTIKLNKTFVGIILTLLMISPGFSGQDRSNGNNSKTIKEDLDAADRLAAEGKGPEARNLYEAAAARAHDERNPSLESRALASIGRLCSRATKYAEARKYLEQALPLAEAGGDQAGIARVCNSLGIAAQYLGHYEDALKWYKRAVEAAVLAGDLRQKVNSLLNLNTVDLPGTHDESLFHDAIESAQKLGAKDLEARAFHNWGDALFMRGEMAEAMDKLERAAALYEELGLRSDLAAVYTSMGRLNRAHGMPAKALPFYEKALRIQQEAGDKIGAIQSINAMGVAYDAMGNFRQCGELYEKAYALALETGSTRAIDFMRGNLANNLVLRGEFSRAVPLLEEVISRKADSNLANRHADLSRAYEGIGDIAAAREHADVAVELSASTAYFLPMALYRRAQFLRRQGDLEGAFKDSQEVIRLLEQLRSKLVPMDFMKQGFSSLNQEGYSLLLELYHEEGNSEKALEVAELARARAFLDLLATKEAGQKRQTAGPELPSFVEAAPQTAHEISATAVRIHSAILNYWAGEQSLFVWVIHPDGSVASRRVQVSAKRLAELVNAVSSGTTPGSGTVSTSRGSIRMVSTSDSRDEWRELYNLLILPVKRLLPSPGQRLTIIPHGPLMRLPFAALLDGKGRYLLEDYPLHYSVAAALLKPPGSKSGETNNARRFLLVADPALPPVAKGEDPLPPLPGARAEVRSIAQLLPGGDVTLLQGTKATKQAVTDSMSKASVIHFATHGVGEDAEPMDSYLALAGDSPAPGASRLTAREVYGLDLHSDLVVLSSCMSGGGKLTGEGIGALARAFIYAGAPSLIVSLWDVPDQPAGQLLSKFYSSWLRGRDKIDALRVAQLQLLANLRAGRVKVQSPAGDLVLPEDPVLWAGFILLGEP